MSKEEPVILVVHREIVEPLSPGVRPRPAKGVHIRLGRRKGRGR
jgi:hypothetical protein